MPCFFSCFKSSESSAGLSSVALKLGIWDKIQEGGITTVLKEFTRETNIRVDVEITPWEQYWTLLEAAATGATLPDVFWMHSNQAIRYADNGMLMDLTDRIARSAITDLSKFPQDLVGLYSFNGKYWAIPKDLDTIALWYNKTMFDAAGLSYPDTTWTWDTLKGAAKKLTTPEHHGFAVVISNQELYFNFIFQNGGWVISADKKKSGYGDPKTIGAIQYLVDFVREGLSPGLSVTAENSHAALFESGRVAMAYFGSWTFSELGNNEYVKANCDLTIMPSANNGKRATIYNGLGWVASARTKHPEEAWKLLEFFSREDVQHELSQSGIAISAYQGTAEAWTSRNTRFNLRAYTDQIPYGEFYPYSKNAVVWHTMTDELLRDAWNGSRSVPEVCADIERKMNEMLANE
ncbi:MAG: sugar ABC transporter substrate-binding protein [Treponema sp.]|nr:sugar ABC transporter substrate-binding protein [Treponema sp.]